jgi:DNA-directed RNA polymerase specialized sigma24 family protein
VRGSDRYGAKEVRRIVENYQTLQQAKDTTHWGMHALVLLADVDRALEKAITWPQWEVVLLHGLLGYRMTDVAKWLSTSERSAYRRYDTALEQIQWFLNGGA